ncbi:MAG: 30S ribosomal protein S15 [Planctomycetota bacterium]|nr:MAG: 30S ribosomal protein S15 [Planctomycetota bacterium]
MNKSKKEIIQEYRLDEKDTGSVFVQVALLTYRINHITEHLKKHKKDHSTRRGLLKLVGKRSRMLRYLKKKDTQGYLDLIRRLDLRK